MKRWLKNQSLEKNSLSVNVFEAVQFRGNNVKCYGCRLELYDYGRLVGLYSNLRERDISAQGNVTIVRNNISLKICQRFQLLLQYYREFYFLYKQTAELVLWFHYYFHH